MQKNDLGQQQFDVICISNAEKQKRNEKINSQTTNNDSVALSYISDEFWLQIPPTCSDSKLWICKKEAIPSVWIVLPRTNLPHHEPQWRQHVCEYLICAECKQYDSRDYSMNHNAGGCTRVNGCVLSMWWDKSWPPEAAPSEPYADNAFCVAAPTLKRAKETRS